MAGLVFLLLRLALLPALSGSPLGPSDSELYGLPMLFINLDHKLNRRSGFLEEFGRYNRSGSLSRVRGINGADDADIAAHLDCPLSSLPGLAETAPGEPPWDAVTKRPQWTTGPMWRGAVGCALAHLSAAAEVLRRNLSHVLVLEDDMTLELQPFWPDEPLKGILSFLPPDWEAVQLSLISGDEAWEKLRSHADGEKAIFLTFQGIWLASNGAYLLSRRGAQRLLDLFQNPVTGKFDLSPLLCINADLCMLPLLEKKFLRVPPLFLHKHVSPTALDSDIAGLQIPEGLILANVTEGSRQQALQWAKRSFEIYSQPYQLADYEALEAGVCRNPEIGKYVDLPVLVINDDAHVNRLQRIKNEMGCLELFRVPAFNNDENSANFWKNWVDTAIRIPPLAQMLQGNGNHPQAFESPLFMNTLLSSISHIRAASILIEAGLDNALIIEDTVVLDLLPHWDQRNVQSFSSIVDQFLGYTRKTSFSLLQLSYFTDAASFDKLLHTFNRLGGESVVIPDAYMRGTGAYIMSRQGAKKLLNIVYRHVTGKISLSMLRCVNFDMCVSPILGDKGAIVPPLFLEGVISNQDFAYSCRNEAAVDASSVNCDVNLMNLDDNTFAEVIEGEEALKASVAETAVEIYTTAE